LVSHTNNNLATLLLGRVFPTREQGMKFLRGRQGANVMIVIFSDFREFCAKNCDFLEKQCYDQDFREFCAKSCDFLDKQCNDHDFRIF
jgi:hypothetical protein